MATLACVLVLLSFVFLVASDSASHLWIPSQSAALSYEFMGQYRRVWENPRRQGSSLEYSSFIYEPLLLVDANHDGKGGLSRLSEFGVGKYLVSVHLSFHDAHVKKAAVQAVQKKYGKVDEESIMPMHIDVIAFDLVDCGIYSLPGNPHLRRSSIPYPTEFDLEWVVDSKEAALQLMQLLPEVTLAYTLYFGVSDTFRNEIIITKDILLDTDFANVLNGQPTSSAYVHREELKRISHQLSQRLSTHYLIEKPEEVEDSVYAKLQEFIVSEVDILPLFGTQQTKSLLNANDLKPDKVESEISKSFVKEHNKNEWRKASSINGNFGTSASIFNILSSSVNAAASGTFHESQMKDLLRQSGVEAEWKGEKWQAKKIFVQQMDMSRLVSQVRISDVKSYVKNRAHTLRQELKLGYLAGQATAAFEALHKKMDQLFRVFWGDGGQYVEFGSQIQFFNTPSNTAELRLYIGNHGDHRAHWHFSGSNICYYEWDDALKIFNQRKCL